MRFVVAAGVGTNVEQLLRQMGYFTVAVRDVDPHLPDREVLARAGRHAAIVVTRDEDFGDLVFKEHLPHHGVLLLRLGEATGAERATILRLILETHGAELPDRFAVYQNDRLRINS